MPRASKDTSADDAVAPSPDPFIALVTLRPKRHRKKVAADPAAPKPPPRRVCFAIVKRFLKLDQNIYWPRELPTLYRLLKQYPDPVFWECYCLPFGEDGLHALNHMSWFESDEGKAALSRAWLLYNWTPPEPVAPETHDILGLDADDPTQLSCPILPEPKPRTVAEWLRKT